jgi:hypothetical protein
MALEDAEVQKLKTEKYLLSLEVERKTKAAAAAAVKKVTPNQILHTKIVSDPVVAGAKSTMDNLDYCTLWWVVQWGLEYLARRKDTVTKEEAQRFASYKDFVRRNKKKREAGFLHFKVTPFSTPAKGEASDSD